MYSQFDQPEEQPILVNIDRDTLCPKESADESWLAQRKQRTPRIRRPRENVRSTSVTKNALNHLG